jgi:DNA-binding CsgD family transcriptional regulator
MDAQQPTRAPEDALLLERERELSALRGVVAGIAQRAGELVIVEGAPGVGKTRLVADARAAARAAGLQVLEARGAELERDFAFGVARQLLEGAVVGGDDELFAGAAGAARRLFEAGDGEAGADQAGFATLHGLYWLVVNLSDRGPVLLSLDDAHWADEPSMRFLDYLGRRVDGLRVGAVLAGRPPEGGVWEQVAAQPDVRLVRPLPLSPQAAATLVRGRLGADASDELCAACHLATSGNPLFLRELLSALEAGQGPTSPDEVTAVGPSAVARFVRHRLAGLGEEATELARAVAVLGDGTDRALAGAVAGVDDVGGVADALVRADVLAPDEALAFVHPIVRAAIYEELAPGERRARHAAAAQTLAAAGAPPERVAAHVVLGGAADAAVLRAAAASAVRRGAPDAAAGYLRRALDDPAPPAAARAEILTELGRCEVAAVELPAADEHLRAALALDIGPALRAPAATMLARAAIVSGGLSAETAASTLEAVAGELRDADPQSSLALGAELLMLTAAVPQLRHRLLERLAAFTAQAAGDGPYEAVAEIHASHERLLSGGPAHAAVASVQAALARGLPEDGQTNAVFIALTTLMLCEHHDTATRWLRAGLEMARRVGQVARQGVIHGQLAANALARGDLDDALVEAEVGLALVDERHAMWLQLVSVATAVHLERGDLEAAAAAAELCAGVDETRDRIFLDDLMVARGRLRIARGEVQRGVADLMFCGERLAARAIRWPCDWSAHAVPALASLGDERAEPLARRQLEVVRRVGAAGRLGQGLRAAAAAVEGDERLELLEEAVAVLRPSPARLELAHALHDLGAELGRRRRRREGREVLRLAVDLATSCGAHGLAERARAELAAGGGRRARMHVTGAEALTPAERRVCELASDGELTNRAIAQSLYVTEKTVELHLSNAYRKLGIRSRFQLAESIDP